VCEVDDAKCTHEEADTRMILHAVHYSTTGSNGVVVVSEDTDVFVLCVSFSSQVPCPLYVKCGSKTRTQYFDVKKVAQMLEADKCKALPGLHAFTGCDTVSAFAGKGKPKGLGLISKSAQHREALTLRGSVMSCMRVCRKQALSRVKYYYCATISKIQQATIMTV